MNGLQQAERTAIRRTPGSRAGSDFADTLTIAAIWLLIFGGVVREVLGQSEMLSFGFYTFHSVDPGAVIGIGAAAAHIAGGRIDRSACVPPILVIALLIVVNFMRGMAVDPASALLWGRANLGIAAFLLLAIAMRPSPAIMRTVRTALLAAAGSLAVLVLVRLATGPDLFMTVDIAAYDVNDGGRPLSSQGTFLMVIASAMLTSQILRRRHFAPDATTLFALALPVLILLTRQGTANIAEFLVLATIFAFERGRLQAGRALLVIVGLGAMFLAIITFQNWLAGSEDIIRRAGNLEMREKVWEALSGTWPTLPWFNQLVGYPGGQYPDLVVYMSGRYIYWERSIHSMYYGTLPMIGYAGAISFLALLAILFFQTISRSLRKGNPLSSLPLACCVATATLSFSYELRADSLIGLFLAIALLRIDTAKARRPRELALHSRSGQRQNR